MTGRDYEVGMLVTHPRKPDWGLGKVLAITGDIVTVFFRGGPGASPEEPVHNIKVSVVPLDKAPAQSDPWLDNLPPWDGGKFKTGPRWWTQQQALDNFLQTFPQGFNDPKYVATERDYKWAAHELFVESLSAGQAEQLMASGDLEELLKRVLRVVHSVNLISKQETIALQDGTKNAQATRLFLRTLFDVLSGPGPRQDLFEPYINAVRDLPAEEGKARVATWPVLTIVPFLARPDCFMFMKPTVTNAAADRLAFNLNYSPKLNWLSYECLLRMSELLLDQLRPHGARDFIDVQTFIWLTGQAGGGAEA